MKTSGGKVVEQSISYEITIKYKTESVSLHLKYWLKLTYPIVASTSMLARCHDLIGHDQRVSKPRSGTAARVETDAEKWNLGQICHALVCRRTEPAESTMPLISLELSDTES